MVNSIGKRFRRALQHQIEGIPAEQGRLEDDGSYTVRVEETDDQIYCRLWGDKNQTVIAVNHRTAYRARLPVRVRKNSSKRYEVLGTDPIPAAEFLGEAAPTANVPPLVGETLNLILPDENYRPGRLRPHTGADLTVYIEPFVYGGFALGGVTLSLTTVVGTIGAGLKAPIVICVAPGDNTPSATKGTDVGTPIPITRAIAAAVTIPTGEIRLWAYAMIQGDTTLPINTPGSERVFDLRNHLGNTAVAPSNATFITQTPSSDLSNEQALSTLATGQLRVTTATGVVSSLKDNIGAAVAPTVNEDSGDGYSVGSRWYDTTADKEYVALDVTVGAAVWVETTGGAGTSPWQTTAGVVNLVTAGDTVNVGGTGALAKLAVDGDDDEVQLLVRGHSTQTAPIATIELDGGSRVVRVDANLISLNNIGGDIDTQIKGDTDADLLYADASTDRVGIGTSAPGAKLDVRGSVIINEAGGDFDARIEGDTDPNLFVTDASTDRAGHGVAAPLAKHHVVGTNSGTIVDRITAHASQSVNIFQVENSGGGSIFEIQADGGCVGNQQESSTGDFQWNGDTVPVLSIAADTNNAVMGSSTVEASALLLLVATDKGFRPPAMTAAQMAAIASPIEALMAYATDTDMLHIYDTQRFRNIAAMGWQPYAIHEGIMDSAANAPLTVAANGGSVAIPITISGHMLLESVSVRQISGATARTWGWDLYAQYLNNGNSAENTLVRVAESNGDDSFTPVAASTRTLAATADTYLGPGLYWLVVQSTHATSTFVIGGRGKDTQYPDINTAQTKTTTNPNGASIDMVAATWVKVNDIYGVTLNGVVFGQAGLF